MRQKKQNAARRSDEITEQYLQLLDQHLEDVVNGDAAEMMPLSEIAARLFVSHQHLTDTVQKATGNHPCYFYDLKIIERAQQMLKETDWPVAAIALKLTYDPSNFSKFFRKFTGRTPGAYRLASANGTGG
ncbi:helix-turn-helix domain-containing protein [Niabella drilacis]|uniref:AraC-type DNA-binding protein n=1 Tax=Niabella drilacis (strain DSM 25811 / CCM 8410 / CCUG 62505 / LMG 26954 / E90) TaxID=1285928 RepID=A0A1G6TSI6_NIADE|nr:AraC family transcriptional regulator [Niabella drilacis]SDD31864.1 AraC-type DNA-binding protein [Niabella drilacis]